MTKRAKVGALIAGAGVMLLLGTLGLMSGGLFLTILGVGFIGAYIAVGGRREYGNVGFLIPGAVLAAIGVYSGVFEGAASHGSLFFLGLSAAFFAVFAAHTYWFRGAPASQRYWPLYPAGGLAVFFGLIYGGEVLGWQWTLKGLTALNYAWIIGLIGLGLWMMLRGPAHDSK